MGRLERPVDPGDGPVHRFAADLRAVRRAAGNPTYRELANRSHYSPSALSRAASGQALPTLEVTVAFVTACHGDAQEWRLRWQQLADETGTEPVAAEPAPVVSAPASAQPSGRTERRGWGSRRWLALAAAGTVALASGLVAWAVLTPGHTAAVAGRSGESLPAGRSTQSDGLPPQPVTDGMDPKRSGCAPDGVTIDSVPLIFPAQRLAGTVELRYSPHCSVAWTRFVPAPTGRGAGDTVTVEVLRPADGVRIPFTITYGDDAVFSDVLLVGHGCVVARAWVVTEGQQSPPVDSACLSGPRPGNSP